MAVQYFCQVNGYFLLCMYSSLKAVLQVGICIKMAARVMNVLLFWYLKHHG